MSLFEKIRSKPDHPLYELLPPIRQRPLREREHDFVQPRAQGLFGKDPGVGWSRDSQNLGFFR